jgi:predicted  nucleic acid-binding Zn-ribbon protein
MPYKCVHCEKVYEDGSEEILKGCNSCHSKFFFYIRKEKLEELEKNKKEKIELSSSEKKQVEQDIRDIVGAEDEETPVFLDFESIKVIKPGKYLLDISKLFEIGKPRVYQLEDGKYIVDLSVPRG